MMSGVVVLDVLFLLLCFGLGSTYDKIYFGNFARCKSLAAVTTLPPNIETLVLTRATIETLPAFAFSHLRNLTELNIQTTMIEVVNRNAFADLPNLRLLSISTSTINMIETGAFNGIWGFSSFDITQSDVGIIHPKAFSNITDVKEFEIKLNNISFISSKAFYDISNIGKFQFDLNNVTEMKEGAFSAWRNVNKSTVNENTFKRVECFSASSFAVASSFSFHRNFMECACHVAWMLISPHLKDQLLSNMCHDSIKNRNWGMTAVSMNDLNCPADPSQTEMGCRDPDSTTDKPATDVSGPSSSTTDTLLTAFSTAVHNSSNAAEHKTDSTYFTRSSLRTSSISGDVTKSPELDTSGLGSSSQSLSSAVVATVTPFTIYWSFL